MSLPAALVLEGIGKRFGRVVALDGASIEVRQGTVHALLGENGAGKTTLMRVAFGMVRADTGTVRIDGRAAAIRSPADAIAAGMGMVHQHFALIPRLTVAENIALGGRGLYSRSHAAEQTLGVGRTTGLVLDPGVLAGALPIGGQQRLEIVKALARNARLLVLDEPTAVLAPAEASQLLRQLRAFADAGRTIVLVTHKLREALSIADDVTVLRHGASVFSGPAGMATEQSLIGAILGQDPASPADGAPHPHSMPVPGALSPDPFPHRVRAHAADHSVPSTNNFVKQGQQPVSARETAAGEETVLISARNVTILDASRGVRVRNASFDVRRGEILGVAGIEGAGQRELLRALAGRLQPSSGTLVLPAGIGFIPEDRAGDALILGFSLTENMYLRNAGSQAGMIDWSALEARTTALLASYDVRAAGSRALAATLSGGNQQKFVVARELEDDPQLLIAENPIRGLDIKAGAAIRMRLRSAADKGTAIVFHSSDLDEVLDIADRVLVIYGGSVDEVSLDRELVGRRMLGLL